MLLAQSGDAETELPARLVAVSYGDLADIWPKEYVENRSNHQAPEAWAGGRDWGWSIAYWTRGMHRDDSDGFSVPVSFYLLSSRLDVAL